MGHDFCVPFLKYLVWIVLFFSLTKTKTVLGINLRKLLYDFDFEVKAIFTCYVFSANFSVRVVLKMYFR